MRYVGRDDSSIYLKCRHCKKIHAYKEDSIKKRNGTCELCGKPYRFISFFPLKSDLVRPWLPPFFMAVFFGLVLFLLSFPHLLKQYQFNRIVTTSSSLFTSIFIPVLGSVVSFLPTLPGFKNTERRLHKTIPSVLVLIEGISLIFVMNNLIESRFNSLELENPDTGEIQQYFGTVTGEYATGKGRVFDNHGNLVYYGGFSGNLYEGYGEKYEVINAVHNSAASQSYQCVYQGEFKEGIPDGQGREYRYDAEYTFEKQEKESPYLYYQGEFLEGEYCGTGILYGVTRKHQGGFFKGKYNGYGNEWYLDSDKSKIYRMEGYYSDGKLNGQGTKYFPNGQVLFTGDYENGSGISGTFYFESGKIQYEGGVADGKNYDGNGTLYWESGGICYDGDWVDGKREGSGTSYREDGTKEYEGGWSEGKRSGYGTSYHLDGVTCNYAGRWKEGNWSGNGEEYYTNGKLKRKGKWVDGKFNGDGEWYWENGVLFYIGEFVDGKQQGYGTAYWENGNISYKGEWADGKYSGEGIRYWDNGEIFYEGSSRNGELEGYGSTYWDDGTLNYTGNFSNGFRSGEGTSYWRNGNVQYTGWWSESQYSGQGKEYNEEGELLHEGTFIEGTFIPDSEEEEDM